MRKKIRSNRKIRAKRRVLPGGGFKAGLWIKTALGLSAVAGMSVFFIFCHDLITQSSIFSAEQVNVLGYRRLTEAEVLSRAQIRPGMNVLGVNLAQARKRLLAHPWIAEADLSREMPSRISIRITEHQALAVIDLGRKFLIDPAGIIFKEFEAGDPSDLPVVQGLRFSDLYVHDRPPSAKPMPSATTAMGRKMPQPASGALFEAVMGVLHLGLQTDGAVSNRAVKKIQVDRELGLTLVTAERQTAIKLGFGDFSVKYELLKRIIDFLNQGRVINAQNVDTIDLKNLNRIVLNPTRKGRDVSG